MQAQKLTGSAKLKRNIPLVLLMVPGLVYLLINNYIPMVGLVIAFKKVDFSVGILNSPSAGLENFRFLFASPDAWTITRNTICYNLVFILLDNFLGIVLAVLLNNIHRDKARSIYQSSLLLPHLISYVIVANLVYAFLAPTNGLINTIIKANGGRAIQWYMKADYWPVILTIVHLWKGVGFSVIFYTATLVGISTEYYEAADLDGANKWQQFTKITLPLLKPTAITLMLLSVGRIFSSDFGLFYQTPMNTGILYRTTSTIDTYVYNALMNTGNIAMSSAAGFFQSIVGFICIMSVNMIVRKVDREQAMF